MVVVATKPFMYQGCPVDPGDVCVVTPIESAAMVYQQQARWPSEEEGYGAYRRRDLVAESPEAPPVPLRRRSRRRETAAAE